MAKYRLILESVPDEAQPVHRLRALLKASLRCYRLRCVEAEEIQADGRRITINGHESGKEGL